MATLYHSRAYAKFIIQRRERWSVNSSHAVDSQLLSDFHIRLTAATRALPTVHAYPAHSISGLSRHYTETTLLILSKSSSILGCLREFDFTVKFVRIQTPILAKLALF